MQEHIAIVGTGAVGAYVGGYLSREGLNVTLIDPWPEHVRHMQEQGLALSGLTDAECFSTPVRAIHLDDVDDPNKLPPVGIAFMCVKSFDTEAMTRMISQHLTPDGFIVSLQNCINEPTISGIVGENRTVGCIAAKIAVELTGPGTVRRSIALGGDRHTVFRAGELNGQVTPRVERIVEALSSIDSAKATDNLWGERWSKLCANGTVNGVSAASGLGSNAMAADPDIRWLMIRLAGEGARIGLAHGYKLEKINKFDAEDWVAALEGDKSVREKIEASMQAEIANRSDTNRPSMGQDISKGRRTEIDFINGHIVDRGAELGIDAPAHKSLVEVVKSVESGALSPSPDRISGL